MKVAVFGSLMRESELNEKYLKDATYLGEFNSLPEYDMFKVGAEPVLKKDGITSVRMQIFNTNKKTIDAIGKFRGFIKNNNKKNVNNRKIIDTPYGKAFLFLFNGKTDNNSIISTGDWLDYKSYAKIK